MADRVPALPRFDFRNAGIVPGVRVRVRIRFKNPGTWPVQCTGVVDKVYPAFALVLTGGGYRTTVHISTPLPMRNLQRSRKKRCAFGQKKMRPGF